MKTDVQLCLKFVCEKRPEGVAIVESLTRLVIGEYSLFSGLEMSHEGNVFWRLITPAGKAELLREAARLGIEFESENQKGEKE